MGLDQYMFRCSKPKVKEGRIYERGDSLIDNCFFIPKDEIDSPAYRSLKQFSVPIKMEENVYDVEKMAENYDMNKEKCHICGIIGGDIHITDGNKKKKLKKRKPMPYIQKLLFVTFLYARQNRFCIGEKHMMFLNL